MTSLPPEIVTIIGFFAQEVATRGVCRDVKENFDQRVNKHVDDYKKTYDADPFAAVLQILRQQDLFLARKYMPNVRTELWLDSGTSSSDIISDQIYKYVRSVSLLKYLSASIILRVVTGSTVREGHHMLDWVIDYFLIETKNPQGLLHCLGLSDQRLSLLQYNRQHAATLALTFYDLDTALPYLEMDFPYDHQLQAALAERNLLLVMSDQVRSTVSLRKGLIPEEIKGYDLNNAISYSPVVDISVPYGHKHVVPYDLLPPRVSPERLMKCKITNYYHLDDNIIRNFMSHYYFIPQASHTNFRSAIEVGNLEYLQQHQEEYRKIFKIHYYLLLMNQTQHVSLILAIMRLFFR